MQEARGIRGCEWCRGRVWCASPGERDQRGVQSPPSLLPLGGPPHRGVSQGAVWGHPHHHQAHPHLLPLHLLQLGWPPALRPLGRWVGWWEVPGRRLAVLGLDTFVYSNLPNYYSIPVIGAPYLALTGSPRYQAPPARPNHREGPRLTRLRYGVIEGWCSWKRCSEHHCCDGAEPGAGAGGVLGDGGADLPAEAGGPTRGPPGSRCGVGQVAHG